MRARRRLVSLILAGMASSAMASQDWPMWGGTAQRNMTSAMKGLPDTWDAKGGTNIKWKAQIGSASNGNPVVADGKIFLGTNNGNPRNPEITGDKGVLMCFRESDGKFLWQAVTDKLDGDSDWPEEGVCSSAAVEGKRLYYVSNRGELICLDTEGFMDGRNDGPFQDEAYKGPTDADIIWRLDMRKELGVAQLYMAASAPVVWEDLVFVGTPNGRDSADEKVLAPKAPSFLAVNKNTGKVVWQDNSPGEGILHGQWASAGLAVVDGVQQAIFPGGDGWLYALQRPNRREALEVRLEPQGRRVAQNAELRPVHTRVQRGPCVHECRAGSGPPERCRTHVLHQSRAKGRQSRNRAGSGSTTRSADPFRPRRSPTDWSTFPT